MNFHARYHTRRWMRGCWLGSLGLLLFCAADLAAQGAATLEYSVLANGGDTRSGDYGEMSATIGEPLADDVVEMTDDKSTWIGFWQVVPLDTTTDTTTGVREELDPTTAVATGISAAPNPFSSALGIEVRLAVPGYVRLVAYDLVGRPAAVLIDGRREAGTIRLEWRPDGLEAGSYILRLSAGGVELPTQIVHYYR